MLTGFFLLFLVDASCVDLSRTSPSVACLADLGVIAESLTARAECWRKVVAPRLERWESCLSDRVELAHLQQEGGLSFLVYIDVMTE